MSKATDTHALCPKYAYNLLKESIKTVEGVKLHSFYTYGSRELPQITMFEKQ